MFSPKVITDAVQEPVTAAYVKLHCKVDGATEDDLFNVFIPASRRFFENATGSTVHEKTLEMAYDAWAVDHFELPRATPLIAISSIKYLDSTGTETTWASSNYITDTHSELGRVARAYGISWPSATLYPLSPIRIRYRAGIATTSPETAAPADIKAAIALLTMHFYENRSAVLITQQGAVPKNQAVAMAAESIIRQNIVWRFA